MKISHLLILLIYLISCNRVSTANESQSVVLLYNEKNLGGIPNNKEVKMEIRFQNPSDKKIRIESFQESCGCTNVKMTSKEIKAKSAATVSVTYDPKDDSGATNKKIMFRLNNGQLLTYTFLANVVEKT